MIFQKVNRTDGKWPFNLGSKICGLCTFLSFVERSLEVKAHFQKKVLTRVEFK